MTLDAGFYLQIDRAISFYGWSAVMTPVVSTVTLLGGGILLLFRKPLGSILLSIGLAWRCTYVALLLDGYVFDRSIKLAAYTSGADIMVPPLSAMLFPSVLLGLLLFSLITVVFFRQRRR